MNYNYFIQKIKPAILISVKFRKHGVVLRGLIVAKYKKYHKIRKIIAYKKVIGGPLPKLIILGQKLKKTDFFFVELGKNSMILYILKMPIRFFSGKFSITYILVQI